MNKISGNLERHSVLTSTLHTHVHSLTGVLEYMKLHVYTYMHTHMSKVDLLNDTGIPYD